MSKVWKNLMIDIESLGNKNNFVITQLAAVAFDKITGETGPEFMINIDIQNSLDLGFNVDASTILWWLEQDNDARQNIIEGSKKALRVDHALFEFRAFVESLQPSTLCVFGNGATFDISSLKSYYYKLGKQIPWKHTLERDVRTIVEFNPEIKTKWINNFKGVKHNSIDDCKNQIGYVCEIYNNLETNKMLVKETYNYK